VTRELDTVIIGAGPAGLAVGATLREAGIPFEMTRAGLEPATYGLKERILIVVLACDGRSGRGGRTW